MSEAPRQTKKTLFDTECKNGCGYLSVPIPTRQVADEVNPRREIRCLECSTINTATSEEL